MASPTWEIRVGDVLDRLREMPDESVHMICTSPPYWGLRDYGTADWDGGDPACDHRQGRPGSKRADGIVPDETIRNRDGAGSMGGDCGRCGARRIDQQIGLEPTPEAYVARMVEVFREVRRVLRGDGTLWLNLGDSYNAAGREGHGTRIGYKQGTNRASANGTDHNRPSVAALKPKDLVGIPWMVAFALRAEGWYLRSDIIFAKPNPMPESVTDRPTKAHEMIFLLTKSARYFYDADAIREPHSREWATEAVGPKYMTAQDGRNDGGKRESNFQNPAGRNARSVWTIATQPYSEAHFATFPEELPRRCILAGTSERGVCPECGAPWRRVVEREYVKSPVHGAGSVVGRHYETGANGYDGSGMPRLNLNVTTTGWEPTCAHGKHDDDRMQATRLGAHRDAARARGGDHDNPFPPKVTVGWDPTCEHAPDPVPATVLDPFAGAGTTVMVALQLGRSGIGIELNPEYADMARRRILADHGAVVPTNGATPAGVAAVQGRLDF